MENIVIIGIIILIIGVAIYYVIKEKKSGKKCIGCSQGCTCPSNTQYKQNSCSGQKCNYYN